VVLVMALLVQGPLAKLQQLDRRHGSQEPERPHWNSSDPGTPSRSSGLVLIHGWSSKIELHIASIPSGHWISSPAASGVATVEKKDRDAA
jgi:hypothetical protein